MRGFAYTGGGVSAWTRGERGRARLLIMKWSPRKIRLRGMVTHYEWGKEMVVASQPTEHLRKQEIL